MPQLRALRQAGLKSLAKRIVRHGGSNALGARLDLEVVVIRKERLNWGPFCLDFAIAILDAAGKKREVYNGMVRMPTVAQLKRMGVEDVQQKMSDFGGEEQVRAC